MLFFLLLLKLFLSVIEIISQLNVISFSPQQDLKFCEIEEKLLFLMSMQDLWWLSLSSRSKFVRFYLK